MPQPTEILAGYALITGASTGIGAAFSRRLAAEGRPLVLIARDRDRLERNAAELKARFGVMVEVLAVDLATDDGCAAAVARLTSAERPVDTLINNAGIGLHRRFDTTSIADEEQLLNLNVRAVLRLSHAAVAVMKPRRRGEIINVSSVAGFLPRGMSATYGASKAWVTSLTESLALLLAGSGVRVCALCPGFVHTEFHARLDREQSRPAPGWLWLDADEVVADCLQDARAGRALSIPSKRFKVIVLASRVSPRRLLGWATSRR